MAKRAAKEGEIICKLINKRMIDRNQNILLTVTGGTGSGKSYCSIRICELWYKKHFDKPFPIKNVAFNVEEVVKLLDSGELEKGELIIFEEGGVNLGALDFQSKISKLFTYVLQSFRSMNIGLIINLPVLTMLNKSARLLIHVHLITTGINYQSKTCQVKCFLHQLNQQSGKVYSKYPRIKINGIKTAVKRLHFQIPSKTLVNSYEKRKERFVKGVTTGLLKETKNSTKKKVKCLRCKYRWIPKVELPWKCPSCQSLRWNRKEEVKKVNNS